MNRRLLVLRHAKSSWDDESVPDHDRPLNRRGERDAPRMGRLLREERLLPGLALCSTAARARATLDLVLEAAAWRCEVQARPALYGASPQEILAVLAEAPESVESVLVVGHNPGLEELVRDLTGQPITLPTAALAALDCDCESWNGLAAPASRARLAGFWKPKEL